MLDFVCIGLHFVLINSILLIYIYKAMPDYLPLKSIEAYKIIDSVPYNM